jgi:hypothetical protein
MLSSLSDEFFQKDSKPFRKRKTFFQKKKNRLSGIVWRPFFILL